jgi:hypothetical protein
MELSLTGLDKEKLIIYFENTQVKDLLENLFVYQQVMFCTFINHSDLGKYEENHGVLLKLYELDQYDDAELVRKKTAAMFAGFI